MPGKEVREAIIRLRENGYSHGEIANELRHVGVSKQTSFYTCKKFAKTGTVDNSIYQTIIITYELLCY